MIKRPGQQQPPPPVSPLFMWSSLGGGAAHQHDPDRPRRVDARPAGPGSSCSGACTSRCAWALAWAFVFGLCMDVHQASMLGQHALSYTTLGFFAITIHRRLLWYPVFSQALQVLPLFAVFAGWSRLSRAWLAAAYSRAGRC